MIEQYYESQRRKEFKEIPEDAAKFLAGIFEMGGSMSMSSRKQTKYTAEGKPHEIKWVGSIIQYQESSEEKVSALVNKYGGTKHKHGSENSWLWTARGPLARHLLNAIEPYAPNRKEEIKAFQALYKSQFYEEKENIAKALSRYNHTAKSYPDISAYKELVKDSAFIAGVFHARANLYDYTNPLLILLSENVTLISALQNTYGGSLVPIPYTDKKTLDGNIPVSFQLRFAETDRKKFLRTAYPSLISNKAEVARIIGEAA